MIFRFILWAVLLYFIVRFVFNFMLPVIRITSQASKKMRDMQQKMDDLQKQQTNSQSQRPIEGDYIDYEEVQ